MVIKKLTPYQIAANKYIPLKTNVLFVAEAPPDCIDRYFYFENVSKQDSLFLELMRVLYMNEFGDAPSERPRKKEWLTRFKDDDYRLIDALKEPVGQSTSPHKRKKLLEHIADDLINEIRSISPNQIVLIKATVYDALYGLLLNAGLPVVKAKLPFPGSGRQNEFAKKFEKMISDGRLTLSN